MEVEGNNHKIYHFIGLNHRLIKLSCFQTTNKKLGCLKKIIINKTSMKIITGIAKVLAARGRLKNCRPLLFCNKFL